MPNKTGKVHGHTTHGMSRTSDYRIWHNMLMRCNSPRCNTYPKYGARGIKVCDRWHTFENFFADMGPRPSPVHSLDRYPDQSGGYEPGNVRWATRTEQNNNTSRNRMVEFRGEVMSISDAIRKSGSPIAYGAIMRRLGLGWDLEKALTKMSQRRPAA